MAVISNNSWVIKLGSVVKNYVDYMEKNYHKMYADIIYPKLYGKKYEEPVQLDMFGNDDNLSTDKETVSQANKLAKEKGQFKTGNEYRFKSKSIPDNQKEMDLEDNHSISDIKK